MKKKLIVLLSLFLVVLVGLGIGLGIGLSKPEPIDQNPPGDSLGQDVNGGGTGQNNNQTSNSGNGNGNTGSNENTGSSGTNGGTSGSDTDNKYSEFYEAIDKEIQALIEYYTLFVTVTSDEPEIDNGEVTYTLSFNMEEAEASGYDFDMMKEIYNETINGGNAIITEDGEKYSSTIDFKDATYQLEIIYQIKAE